MSRLSTSKIAPNVIFSMKDMQLKNKLKKKQKYQKMTINWKGEMKKGGAVELKRYYKEKHPNMHH